MPWLVEKRAYIELYCLKSSSPPADNTPPSEKLSDSCVHTSRSGSLKGVLLLSSWLCSLQLESISASVALWTEFAFCFSACFGKNNRRTKTTYVTIKDWNAFKCDVALLPVRPDRRKKTTSVIPVILIATVMLNISQLKMKDLITEAYEVWSWCGWRKNGSWPLIIGGIQTAKSNKTGLCIKTGRACERHTRT